jgi:hypothetical protein
LDGLAGIHFFPPTFDYTTIFPARPNVRLMTDTPGSLIPQHTLAPAATHECGLVVFANCELVGINNAKMLVINRQNGYQMIMAPEVVECMKTCTTFRTIEAHAAQLANSRPE